MPVQLQHLLEPSEADRLAEKLRLKLKGRVSGAELLQNLWSGYGKLLRLWLEDAAWPTVIVKLISPPAAQDSAHPYGFNTGLSHRRKLESYRVELHWYSGAAFERHDNCRLPAHVYSEEHETGSLLVLEDLDRAGFSERRHRAGHTETRAALKWLAWFHALHMGRRPDGLWPRGTYWQLATRSEELANISGTPTAAAAELIDRRLEECRYMTLVHGDAKLANFCFSAGGKTAAAVDFQYIGRGCGIKDVIYLLSSVFSENELAAAQPLCLEYYFGCLEEALGYFGRGEHFTPVFEEYSALTEWAWADFARFLEGWQPGHYKLHGFTLEQLNRVIGRLGISA